jgi:hypothetical protein
MIISRGKERQREFNYPHSVLGHFFIIANKNNKSEIHVSVNKAPELIFLWMSIKA